jgi:protein TonB
LFNNLLESKAKKQKSPGGYVVSAVIHVVLIALAVQATLNAGQKKEKRDEKIDFVEVKKDEPPPPKEKPPEVQVAPPPKGFQTLTAPVNIPDVLPDIDLTKKVTNEADFTGKGVAGGREKGVVGAAPVENQTYFEYQVEKPVMAVPGSPSPRYPDILKSAGVEGEVVVAFVVDTTGRADVSSLKILKSTHELFAAAVRTALPSMRFLPAEVGGHKVKQLVQQPFVFNIMK